MTSHGETSKKAKTKKKKISFMKNQNIMFIRSARLFRLLPALAVIALIAVLMQVTLPSARADFNLASLSGSYADGAAGFSSITNQPAHTISAYEPVSGVGLWTFCDGNGNVTANLVLNNGGHVVHPNFTGTYTVNANGTGTINWLSLGTPRRRTFVIGDGGNQVKWVEDDVPATGGVVGGGVVKQ